MRTLDLVQAVCEVLDLEAMESDLSRRAKILAGARVTLTRWREGRLTAEQAIALLGRLQSGGRAASA